MTCGLPKADPSTSRRFWVKRTLLVLFVMMAIVAAAGCGGNGGAGGGEPLTADEYDQEIQQTGAAIESSFAALAANIEELGSQDVTSLDQADEFFGQMAAEIQIVVDDLRVSADEFAAIDPPEDVEGEHSDLIEAVRLLADDFERFATTIESGDFEAIFTEAGMVADLEDSEAGQLLESAIDGLRSKGYNPG